MTVVVQKYGGTSVADTARLNAVADRVRDTRASGNELVVVVSAMGETTDQLVSLASEMSPSPPPREMDMLLTAGERITMALLSMALHERGVPAVSYTGSQAGILTDSSHGEARITRITGERVRESLGEGRVVIVAGFQGVDPERKEVTTLGRGGSDTTAVALAATLGAESCEILTDVAGVYTADPRVVPQARKLESVSYPEMLALATAGAAVLMPHSVEYGMTHRVSIHVRSSFNFAPGSWITADAEPRSIVGLAYRTQAGKGLVTIVGEGARDRGGEAVAALGDAGIRGVVMETGDMTLTIEVPNELLGEGVRCLHTMLFEQEVVS